MKVFQRKFLRVRRVRKGAGVIEYAVLVGVIVIGMHLALEVLEADITKEIGEAKDEILKVHDP